MTTRYIFAAKKSNICFLSFKYLYNISYYLYHKRKRKWIIMFNHSIFWLKLFQAKLKIKINKKHKEILGNIQDKIFNQIPEENASEYF